MKKLLAILTISALLLSSFRVCAAEEKNVDLAGEWDVEFFADSASEKPSLSGKVKVPGALELQGYGYPGYYYEEQGYWGMPEDDGVKTVGVYKKEFTSSEAKKVYLVFESFKDSLLLTFNGKKFDENFNAEMGAVFEIELKNGVNTIEASVTRDNSGINKADNFALSGIMGDVYITDKYPYGEAALMDVSVKDGELFIGGKKEVLRAVRYTPTAPEAGDCISNEQIDEDIALIKEYGFNCALTSAAPLYFYEKAAAENLYVIDEANVNLSALRGENSNALSRVKMMVEKHKAFSSVIMWSVGFGQGGANELISAVKDADSRPVLQEIPGAFSEIEVFGATGGLKDWVNGLGDGNIGGIVKEFADKQLYYTKNIYDFETTDKVSGDKRTLHGEIKNYKGEPMLGDGSFEAEIGDLSRFTLEAYISSPEGNRVLFESADKSVRLEVRDWALVGNLNGTEISTGLGESGKVALVYADGEAQLFVGQSFTANGRAEGKIESPLTIGEGDGATAIKYVKVYSEPLSLDELLTDSTGGLIIDTAFDDISIKEDHSYTFLASGGDFGDDPNSYYKSLKGLFTSEREPHPEAEEIKALFSGKLPDEAEVFDTGVYEGGYASVKIEGEKAYLMAGSASAVINVSG